MSETTILAGGPPMTLTSLLQLEIDALRAGGAVVFAVPAASAVPIGSPIDIVGGTTPAQFRAASPGILGLCGIAANAPAAEGDPLMLVTQGTVTLTTAQWDAVIGGGGGGGLVSGARYYLSGVASKIVATAPVNAGSTQIQVGYALSRTELFVQVVYGVLPAVHG